MFKKIKTAALWLLNKVRRGTAAVLNGASRAVAKVVTGYFSLPLFIRWPLAAIVVGKAAIYAIMVVVSGLGPFVLELVLAIFSPALTYAVISGNVDMAIVRLSRRVVRSLIETANELETAAMVSEAFAEADAFAGEIRQVVGEYVPA